jgi:hypothetical protein
MVVTAAVDAAAPRIARARASALGWGEELGPLRSRSRSRIVGALVLMVVSGWLGAVVFLSAGSRQEVLAVDGGVERFTELSRDDLRVVRVAADEDVPVVDADRLDEIVGRTTSMEVAPGSLLSEDQLLGDGERAVGPGEAVVGALLAQADSPGSLPSGATVRVILRAEAGSTTPSRTLEGWVLDVEEAEEAQVGVAGRWASLVVSEADAGQVSAAAAENRVTVVVLGGS